jgi:hypothetical protein
MANIYQWVIESTDRYFTYETQNNVIFNVYWRCFANDNLSPVPNIASISGVCSLPYVSTNNFINYADLTQEQILEWLWNFGVNQTEIQSQLDSMLVTKLNPTIIKQELPWATT